MVKKLVLLMIGIMMAALFVHGRMMHQRNKQGKKIRSGNKS